VDSLSELHRVVFSGIGMDIEALSISNLSNGTSYPLYIYGGQGDDVFYILRNAGTVAIQGDEGDDRIHVNSYLSSSENSNYVQNAKLNLSGGISFDYMYVNGATSDDSFMMEDGLLTGAGLDITFLSLEKVDLITKGGDDIVNVLDSYGIEHGGSVNVQMGSGNDFITLGNKQMAGVGSIFVDITVDGGDGSDTLAIDDRESVLMKNSTVTADAVTGVLGKRSLKIVRSSIEKFFLNTSQAANTMTILSTAASTDNVFTGLGAPDEFVVLGTGEDSNLTVHGGGGKDVMHMLALGTGTLVTIYGDGDDDTIFVDGTDGHAHPAANLLDGSRLRWSGGDGDDTMSLSLHSVGNFAIEIFNDVLGVNALLVNCTDDDSILLVRKTYFVNIHKYLRTQSAYEMLTILSTATINSVVFWLNGGFNEMFFEDTFAPIEVNGGHATDSKSENGHLCLSAIKFAFSLFLF